ncbi:LysR family transcriptional regulator [Zhihengliuella salsuginis]|uniref:LysR family transcriptional regulator n=1 Tax=Zhihengliuella salsuginis TaxID=578222 RepID=A0ABQ3GHZ1_9MICC|nr:LysR family transcriptional regulator [Zhihengliuella salsuginis]GHD07904.1 LysR family transcriptional regulator [Zhihengliuella salsuginis]
MDLHQLRILRELGDLGSVNAVAREMFVSPSAISQHLSQLQRSVDVPLTRKDGRSLALTDEGRVLADAGAEIAAVLARARGEISDGSAAHRAPVRVAGFHSIGQTVFAPLLTQEERDLPELHFFDEDVSQQQFPALAARYDLVLAHRMRHTSPWPEGQVAVVPLAFEPLDIALRTDHELARFESLDASQVIAEPWVVSRSGYSPDDVLQTIAATAGRAPTVRHRVNDYATVAALVRAGGCLGILPRYTTRHAIPETVTLRPIRGLTAGRQIDLLVRAEHLHRASIRDVVEAIRDTVRRIVAAAPPSESPG